MRAVIVNPASAGGRTGRRWAAFAPTLFEAVGPCEVFKSEAPGHASELAQRCLEQGAEQLIIVGGDGTNHEVINGLFDGEGLPRAGLEQLSLGFLPMGTGSDLCRSLGLPRRPAQAVAALREPPRSFDLIEVELTGWDGLPLRCFAVNVASFGISGEVSRRLMEQEKGGALSYPAAVLAAQRSYENRSCLLSFDGGAEEEHRLLAGVIANGQFFGGGMKIAPDALLDSGALSLVTLGDFSGFDVLRWLFPLYRGGHLRCEKVNAQSGQTLAARPAPGEQGIVPIELDGEPAGRLPAQFKLRRAALRVHGTRLGAWQARI